MMGIRTSWCRFECGDAGPRNLSRIKNGAVRTDRPDATTESESRF